MWNAGGDNNEELSRQMSSALNVRADCLQQFMSGNISVETLAAMKPFTSGPGESGLSKSHLFFGNSAAPYKCKNVKRCQSRFFCHILSFFVVVRVCSSEAG